MAIVYLDSALSYSGVATTTITGLSHLEGKTVYALADGLSVGPFIVSSGQITLNTAASNVVVGLKYKTTIKLLEPDFQTETGTTYGQPKEVHKATAYFIDTGSGVQIGTASDEMKGIPDLGFGLTTCETSVLISDGDKTGQVIVEQEAALPMYLAAVYYDISPGDE